MKLTSSFVLALAAASSVVASPVVVKRQQPSNSLPNPVASVSSAGSSATSRVSSAAASTSTGSAAAPAGPSGTSSAAAPSGTGVIPAGAAPSGTAPGPVVGGNSTTRFNDTQILQYALTLEHLEATFYNQSLSKLSTSDFENAGYNASVRNQIYSIGRDEASHVALLSGALGNKSVPACTYDFSGVTDVDSFLTTARVLEGVGVSAYLGAAQNITNSTYLEIAGSILTVESRHTSYIISQTDDGGNDIPAPYDTPLDFKQVYSLAAPFIASCPSNASLPITAFPALNLTGGATNGSFTPGQQVTVSYSNSTTNSTGSSNGNKYLAIIQGVTGTQFLPLNGNGGSSSQVTLPSNLTGGQMYAVVTSSNRSVTDDNTIAGPAVGYVNIPLPQAPEATATGSSSSSAASSTATGSGSASSANATGTAAAGPAGAAGSSGSMSAPTASAQSGASQAGPTGSQSAPAGPSASGASSQSLGASAISVASANIPRPSASA